MSYELEKSMREKEAAEYLGVSSKTLQAWRFKGVGPVYFKLSRAVVYTKEHLDAFRNANAVLPKN